MTTVECPAGCGRPADGLCTACWTRLAGDLDHVTWLASDLDTVLARQVRYGTGAGVALHRPSEQPLPVNLAASAVATQMRQVLGGWVRELHETHAVRWQECDRCAARWLSGPRVHAQPEPPGGCLAGRVGGWHEQLDPLTVADTAPELARWLLRHPSWIRNHPASGELHADITGAVGAALRIVDRPPDRVYLGICSAEVDSIDENGDQVLVECPADLYVPTGRAVATCPACRAEHVVEDRRRVLATAVENELVATSVLVGLVGALGRTVTSSMIRNLKARGVLRPKVRDPRTGDIVLRGPEDTGLDRWRVGDVLDAISRPERGRPAGEAKAS